SGRPGRHDLPRRRHHQRADRHPRPPRHRQRHPRAVPGVTMPLRRTLALAVLFLGPLAPLGGEPPPGPARLTTDGDFKQHLQWSPDGKKFLFTRIHDGKMGLWTMNADGGDLKPLLTQTNPHFDGHWSPDGKSVVFVFDVLQGTDGKLQINTANADGSENRNVIPHAAFEESPRWSPDGKQIAWVSTRDGNQEIYLIDADGKNLKRLTSEVAVDNNPSWSPDGKRIAFCSGRGGNLDIHVMDRDGGNVRRLTDHPGLDYWP